MITKEKQKAQVKSKFYYIFWGVATVSKILFNESANPLYPVPTYTCPATTENVAIPQNR